MSDYDTIGELQEKGIIDSKRIATIKICLIMFFHASICAVLMSQIFSVWLDQEIHLNALQIGEIMGLKAIVAIFYKPIFGWLLDKTQLRIYFLLSIAILGLAAGPFFQYVYRPLLLTHNAKLFYAAGLLGGVYFGYVVIAAVGAVFSYGGRYIEAHGGSVDKIGASNFLGWLVMSFVLTILYTYSPIWGFYLASFAAFCMCVMLFLLKVKPFNNLNTKSTTKQKVKLVDLKYLIFNPRFYVLAFFSVTIIVVVYAQYSQVGRYVLSFWPQDKETQKYALKFGAYLNIPFNIIFFLLLLFCSSFIKKFNSTRSLVILSLSYGVALLVLGIAGYMHSHMTNGNYTPSLVVSIIAYQLLSLVNPFTNVVILSYVMASFNKKIASTAYLVGFHFLCNLVGSLGNAVVGGMFKSYGWGDTYFDLAGFIFICVIVLIGLIKIANIYDKKRTMSHVERTNALA